MNEKKWSYCTKCMHNQYFVLKDSIYVCEECGKTLQFALVRGTLTNNLSNRRAENVENPCTLE
jgi:ribosomal protein L37AE/L43A